MFTFKKTAWECCTRQARSDPDSSNSVHPGHLDPVHGAPKCGVVGGGTPTRASCSSAKRHRRHTRCGYRGLIWTPTWASDNRRESVGHGVCHTAITVRIKELRLPPQCNQPRASVNNSAVDVGFIRERSTQNLHENQHAGLQKYAAARRHPRAIRPWNLIAWLNVMAG